MEKQIGVLIILSDITQLQRLETVRRDFIANVSHELKTPITSIKGSVETLLQEEEMDGSTLNRFLKIILRHSDRLNSIIEDLLTLSRIEQGCFVSNPGQHTLPSGLKGWFLFPGFFDVEDPTPFEHLFQKKLSF